MMHCSTCHHSYSYEAQTSWLVFQNGCRCECHAWPGKYPQALPGSFPASATTAAAHQKEKDQREEELAKQKRAEEQERAAEERARGAWDSKEPRPEDKPLNTTKPKRVKVPIIDGPPFNRSIVSVRRQTHSLPHLVDSRRSGWRCHRYVNPLPFRRVPNWSRSSRCTNRSQTGLKKIREKGNQHRGLPKDSSQDSYVVSPGQEYGAGPSEPKNVLNWVSSWLGRPGA